MHEPSIYIWVRLAFVRLTNTMCVLLRQRSLPDLAPEPHQLSSTGYLGRAAGACRMLGLFSRRGAVPGSPGVHGKSTAIQPQGLIPPTLLLF